MSAILQTRHLGIFIGHAADKVYDFASRPQNLPQWASGLGRISQLNDQWIAHTDDGDMHLRFAERNVLGVLDHWITTANAAEIYIPLRVIANGSGCEVVFTLFHQHNMSAEQFKADADWIMQDLAALKQIMEAGMKSLDGENAASC